ncbi:MAG TPA: aminotransferase class III-fold pyridoxal phosphate-dependent enzyme [Oligoflexus sp.]|uniref:aminotransferase class III-fold pyridoxal phosphate-dependent enzyme n=1 Tax=Oligoflexus sp. TaxID=1971216 RepID=UPI002D810F37|nr:aminotransferase class III-fold pyridoxal phosphate-dependent enzyme [Oligoflexus sp.]HET9239833.1 aminotransferase class III-fold pyridoxal phosphate-dependent enzyme [Oligoflexus sp.]
MEPMKKLQEMRRETGDKQTKGLDDKVIEAFLRTDKRLAEAIEDAYTEFQALKKEFGTRLQMNERELIDYIQSDFVNFYEADAVNPYVALAAAGPWLITTHGAVLHDSGGYGMIGFGQTPKKILEAMSQHHVMANIMTPNFSQKRLTERLNKEIGHNRKDNKPVFARYLCLNSGSESVTVAARLADLNAKNLTDPGARYAGRKIYMLSMKGSFHGRTERPAQASDSSAKNYQKLATFREQKLMTVEPNNVEQLRAAFAEADKKGIFIEMMLLEPVMGEGNPGVGVTPAFYDEARRLTREHGSLFMIDSIQAGLRAQGCLSICDYPGFETCEAPDMETYSKAVNAGQYPLSILALNRHAAELYQRGIYGNTMTTNPRALDVACAVLDSVTPELRKNIRDRGQEFLDRFNQLREEFPGVVTGATGTGLLCALHLNPEGYKVVGKHGVETWLREQGIGVIHGGKNALRFTPHFLITPAEIDLVIGKIREALKRGPVYS